MAVQRCDITPEPFMQRVLLGTDVQQGPLSESGNGRQIRKINE